MYKFLQERDGLALLKDSMIETATQEILAEKKSRTKINNEIKRKDNPTQLTAFFIALFFCNDVFSSAIDRPGVAHASGDGSCFIHHGPARIGP